DRGLGHSALAQQYHLNALPLSLGHFPMQRRLQLPNLALRAFDHSSPPKQMARWNHKISLPSGTKLPQTSRFNQLWKRYDTNGSVDAILIAIDPDQMALAAAEDSALEARLIERLSGYDQPLLELARILACESVHDYPNGPMYWNEVT